METSQESGVRAEIMAAMAAAAAAAAVIAVAACGAEPKGRRIDTGSAAVFAPGPETAAADTGCALVLPWRQCSLLDRLERAGLAPEERGLVRQPFLTVEGVVYRLGDGELQAFVFTDSAAAARETQTLDSARVSPPRTNIRWNKRPTLMRSSNLVVILLSEDERLIERVSLAVGGGLPAEP